MDTQLLIQSIVRQTTVLIAQISTAVGLRAPLAHIANQVFLDLARELEAQGVRRNVVADMFGLAMRSYQLKVQRAVETASAQKSLWRDVHAALAEGTTPRRELDERFPRVEPRTLSAVLNDLVDSGLAYCSGRGRRAVYGLTRQEDVQRILDEDDVTSLANMLWLQLATHGPLSIDQVAKDVGVEPLRATTALQQLVDADRVQLTDGVYEPLFFDIPLGATQGWEAAVADHFRAVSNAIAAKLSDAQARANDRIGGTTLSFTVYDGHPNASEIYGLLARIRRELNTLWESASDHNTQHGVPDEVDRVTFYFGQSVISEATRPNDDEELS